jgi:hypothetical protein
MPNGLSDDHSSCIGKQYDKRSAGLFNRRYGDSGSRLIPELHAHRYEVIVLAGNQGLAKLPGSCKPLAGDARQRKRAALTHVPACFSLFWVKR